MVVTKGERTKQRMVESMLVGVQAHGYNGTGLSAVVASAGAPKGSLYFHFPEGKEQLGELAVDLAGETFRALLSEAFDAASGPDAPGAVVSAVVGTLAQMLSDSDFQMGCPVSVVALEAGGESDRLRRACERAYESWTSELEKFLDARGFAPAAARSTASAAVSLVEGALIVSRTRHDVGPLHDAALALRTLLDAVADGATTVYSSAAAPDGAGQ